MSLAWRFPETDCGAVEPNQSPVNAAVCDRPEGHTGWHEGSAHGPAADERPGRHRWLLIERTQCGMDAFCVLPDGHQGQHSGDQT